MASVVAGDGGCTSSRRGELAFFTRRAGFAHICPPTNARSKIEPSRSIDPHPRESHAAKTRRRRGLRRTAEQPSQVDAEGIRLLRSFRCAWAQLRSLLLRYY
jgi:hypothetical protein